MEHQANEHIENGLKYQKGGNRSQNSRASTRKTHRYGHTSDQRGPQLKKITLTQQKRHAQRAQDFTSDRMLASHRLDLALFIQTQHYRLVGRVQIQPHHISQLL